MREKLAAYAHTAWAGWMVYMFGKSQRNPDGSVTIPASSVERWDRQMRTPYEDLPESEKASDRKEADDILLLFKYTDERIRALENAIVDLYDQIDESSLRGDTRERVEEVMKDRWRP